MPVFNSVSITQQVPGRKVDIFVRAVVAAAAIGAGISFSVIYLFHVALCVFLLSRIRWRMRIDLSRFRTKLVLIFVAMPAWYFASLLWSWNKGYTLQYTAIVTIGSCISLIVIYYSNGWTNQKLLLKIVGVVLLLEMCIGLLEVFTGFRWPISTLSLSLPIFGRDVTPDLRALDPGLQGVQIHIPTGFSFNRNDHAIAMGILFPFLLFFGRLKLRIVAIAAVFILVIMSGSRGTLLGLFLMLSAYLLLFKAKASNLLIVTALISLVLFAGLTTTLLSDNLLDAPRALTSFLFGDIAISDGSIGVRQELLRNGFNALTETYGWGVGAGASRVAQERSAVYDAIGASMHNVWAEILVDAGVMFAIIFAAWYLATLKQLFKITRRARTDEQRSISGALFLCMLGFALTAIGSSSTIYFFPMWLLFGFSVATINNYQRFKRVVVSPQSPAGIQAISAIANDNAQMHSNLLCGMSGRKNEL